MKKKHRGLLVAIGAIMGFIVLLVTSYYIAFKNYDIRVENDELVINAKSKVIQSSIEPLKEKTSKVSTTIKDLSEKFSIKNNIMSIIILVIGIILYIITKRRSEQYVKREKD